jgi:rRNA maturation RNase YbeY
MAQVELEILGELPQEFSREKLEGWIKTYKYPYKAVTLEIRFVEPGEMRNLNRTYRKKDESTDILEFPTATATKNEPVVHLGSIIVSAKDHERKLGHESSAQDWEELLEHGVGNLIEHHTQL